MIEVCLAECIYGSGYPIYLDYKARYAQYICISNVIEDFKLGITVI